MFSDLGMSVEHLSLGIALDGVGWHPSAWPHSAVAAQSDLFSRAYWSSWSRRAATAGVDFVTIEDGLSLCPGLLDDDEEQVCRVRGRLDSIVLGGVLLVASDIREVVIARNITHSNPFHIASQVASLASIAPGRVVWRPQVSADAGDAIAVGGSPTPVLQPEDIYVPTRIARRLRDLFRDAEDYIATVRRLWATFPSDALATDDGFWRPDLVRPTSVNASRRYGAVGPLPVPVTSPPPVVVLAHHALEPYRLAAAAADRVFLTPTSEHPVAELVSAFRQVAALTPDATPTALYADIAVVLGDTGAHAHHRLDELNTHAGFDWSPDTGIFVGTAESLARELMRWHRSHGISGARLRPAVLDIDGDRILRDLTPLLPLRTSPGFAGEGGEA